ncbi:MAG: lycopene cyclase family protein [Promethearchaeota archaeon]|jgi:flavin-dependent dehydrogenase
MRNPNINYDVIVVGAGAAGCLFSRNLAREDYSVCLVEKKVRNKLSHEWWDLVVTNIFNKVDIKYPESDELLKVGEFILCSPLDSIQVQKSPSGVACNIDRRKFTTRLLNEAIENGVNFYDNVNVIGPIVNEKTHTIIGVKLDNSKIIKAKLIVDCSGYEGVIRSNIPFETDFDKNIRREDTFITYREIRKKLPSVPDSHEIVIIGKNHGLSWISFHQDNYVDFLGAYMDFFLVDTSPKEMVYKLVEKYKDKCGTKILKGGYSASIPMRRALDSCVANGLIIIGDAACQIDPGTGSGVAMSLYAAHIASNVALNALNIDSTKKEDLWPYNVEYHRSEYNQQFSSNDIAIKNFHSLSEEEVEYVFANDIIDLRNFGGSSANARFIKKEKYRPKISVRSKILAHLTKFAELDRKIEEMKELCREYPEEYNPETFKTWREKMNKCYIERYDIDKSSESELVIS